MIEEGKFFFHSHKFKKAEELFKKVVAERNDYADIHNYLGLIAHEEGRYGEAIKNFKNALRINPRYTEAMLNLSILYNDVGDYERAKKLVIRSRKEARSRKQAMDPFIRSKLANKHAEVGDWYFGIGAFKEAIGEYKRALNLESCYADIRTKMAMCLREQGDLAGAMKELKEAVKSNSRCSDAHVQLGITYYAMGKKNDARKVWRSAVRKFPQEKSIRMYLKFTEPPKKVAPRRKRKK